MTATAKPAEPKEPAAEWVSVDKLLRWVDNPRRYSDKEIAAVARSLKEFGFGRSLVARRSNGELIAGHRTLLAAKKLGLKVVPVRMVELDEAKSHALALADNKLEYEVAPQSSADLSWAPRRRQSPARRWLWRRVAIDLQLRAA